MMLVHNKVHNTKKNDKEMPKTTLKICTHPSKKTTLGKLPICLKILHLRKWTTINLPLPPLQKASDLLIDLDGNAEIIDVTYKNRKWANNLIAEFKAGAEKIVLEMHTKYNSNTFSAVDIADNIKNISYEQQNENTSFFDLMQEYVDTKIAIKAYGTADCMKQSIVNLKKFKPALRLKDVDYRFLKKYETWWLAQGNGLNGLQIKLRDIRKVFNEAIKQGLIERAAYPFDNYRIKTVKTKKRALKDFDLQRVKDYKPLCNTELIAKDLFLFSFYCAGINFRDMALLEKRNIQNNRLLYSRAKTGDTFNYPLNDVCLEVLNRHNTNGKYLLPIVLQENLNGMELLTHINNRRSRIGKYMRNIGKNLDLPISLTSYVARHSFASLAKQKNVPIAVISELLGHEDIKTTQIYLASLESDVLDKYLQEITAI